MFVRDVFNHQIDNNDIILAAISPGNFLMGRVKMIKTGLDGSPPVAVVSVDMPLPIDPGSGIVQGAIFVQGEEKKIDVQS